MIFFLPYCKGILFKLNVYLYAKYKHIESKAITLQFTYRFAVGKLKSETKLNQSFIISTEVRKTKKDKGGGHGGASQLLIYRSI